MAYGDGSTTTLANGKVRADMDFGLTASGRRRRISATGRTEAEAKRRLRQRAEALGGKKGGARRTAGAERKTIEKWATDWLATRVEEVRPNTYSTDRAAVQHYIVPTIGRVRLTDVMPADIREVNRAVRAAGHDETTVLRTQRVLVKMLRDAVEEGYTIPGGVFNIKASKAQRGRQKPKRQALDLVQAIAVLGKAAELPHGSRWLTGFYEGMRQGEILGLTEEAIDFRSGFVSLEWQLQALPYIDNADKGRGFRVPHGYEARHLGERFHLVRPKTEKGWRVIPMVDTVREALEVWLPARPANEHGLIWTRPDGRPIPKEQDAAEFRVLQAAANVKHPSGRPYVGHEVRNTTATLLAEAGVEPTIIQAILGHSSYAITQGYIAARRGPMMAAMREVEAAFTQKAIEPPAQ